MSANVSIEDIGEKVTIDQESLKLLLLAPLVNPGLRLRILSIGTVIGSRADFSRRIYVSRI